jgi:hypothetical protein
MVDEILRGFLDELFARYREIARQGYRPREALERIVVVSFEAIESHRDAVAIYQAEAAHLLDEERFGYIPERLQEFRALWHTVLRDGVADGSFRSDLDVDLAYRFMRDTVWVAVRWYRPGGTLDIDVVAQQYLSIVLNGISGKKARPNRG